MSKIKSKRILVIMLAVLAIVLLLVNVFMLAENRRLNAAIEKGQEENKRLSLLAEDTARAANGANLDKMDRAYIYLRNNELRYDCLTNYSSKEDIEQCKAEIDDKELDAKVSAKELSYFEYDGKLGIRIKLVPKGGASLEEIHNTLYSAPNTFALNIVDFEKNEFAVKFAKVESEPPYAD